MKAPVEYVKVFEKFEPIISKKVNNSEYLVEIYTHLPTYNNYHIIF